MKSPIFIRGILLFAIMFVATVSRATNYYVDASTTSSTQNGTLANPWKTLSQVSSNMSLFQPGDFVLFKRGQTFTGTLFPTRGGTASAPLTFGAYGTGAKPKFTGTGNTIGYLFYVNNKSYITFRDLWITDPSIDNADRSIDAKIQRAFTFDEAATNCKIVACDIHLVGVAGYFIGGSNTMDSCDVGNLRMVVDSDQGYQPGNDDDYGANPLVISSANNTITHNYFHDCWATSYDYDFDGGAIEFYGAGTDNNFIAYNTIYDCIGVSEITGNSANNTFAYNKIINNGSLFYFQSGSTYSNYKVFNNVIIENAPSRVPESRLIGGSMQAGAVIMKNNVFQLSNGIDVAGNTTAITHEDNIYKLSNNSVVGFTLAGSEMSTSAAIFVNTAPTIPVSWNFAPAPTSPAIDFGQNVGLTKDFAGNPVPAIPNSGILETAVAGTTLAATSSGSPIICNGGSTTITVSALGGTSPYTGTGIFSVNAGTYTYTVSDASGQSASTTITVSQPSAISVSTIAGTITTYGGTAGVTVVASGGTGTFSYMLNNGTYQGSNIFNAVAAGNHVVTVKDANGCTAVKSFTLTQPAAPAPLVAGSTASSIACNGGTAVVTVSASGGTAPYTGTGTFTVPAGAYNYTVTDALGVTAATSITVTQPTAINVTVAAGTINTYGGSTSATVNATGGTGTLTYRLNTGNYGSSNIFNGLTAGTYSVSVKDASGCTASANFTITQPAAPVLAANTSGATMIACNGGTTVITVTATGGVAPYTGTGDFTVSAGTYTYTVTDANGATATSSVTVNQPAAISIAISAGSIAIFGGTTTVDVNAFGGTGTYSFKLDNGTYQSSNSFASVAAGTHSIRVKDANGCTSVKAFTLTQPAAPATLVASASGGNISCNGGTTTVTVSAAGGVTPYTGVGTFTVGAGTHTYTVTDANGTTAVASVTVAQPSAIVVTVAPGTIAVFGGTTSVAVNATGGTGTYAYQLDNGPLQATNNFTAVSAGNHMVTVTDANGCIAASAFTLTQPVLNTLVASATATTIRCNADISTITVAATGGTAPYTGTGLSTGYAGTYTYTVTDATGASATTTITITQPARIDVTLTATPILRPGETSVISAVASGGVGTMSYKLNNGTFQSGNSFSGVAAGSHNITVKDANNCTVVKTVVVPEPTNVNFKVNLVAKTNVNCRGGNNGSIQVLAVGGRAPYTYQINNGRYSNSATFTHLRAGVYRVTAKDANGNITSLVAFIFDGRTRCTSNGVNQGGRLIVTPFPNPTSDRFSLTIDSETDEDVVVEVMNTFGRKIHEVRGSFDRRYEFGQNFEPGTYFVRVIQGGKVTTKQIIKL